MDSAESIQEAELQEVQESKQSSIDTTFITCKSPQAKDHHVSQVLEDFEKQNPEINRVIELLNKEEAKIEGLENAPLKEGEDSNEQDESSIDREKNELERAMDSVLNARGLIDIIKALYAIEKAMYELNLANKKPDAQQIQKEIAQSKDKPLTIDFLKESLKKLREGKNQIVAFSQNLKLQRAFAKELSRDISMYELATSKQAKSAYEKRIDKKLLEAKERFPNLQDNYPKMLQSAQRIIQPLEKSKEYIKGRGM